MKDLKMQLQAEHAIKDKERAKHEEVVSRAQKEHRKAENKKHPQEVYNSMVHQRTSLDIVKIHLMLHYEESVQQLDA